MKMNIRTCISTSVFQIGCFLFLFLNVSLDSKSLTFPVHNSGTYSTVDSSGNNFLSADYALNITQPEIEEELQLEPRMMESDIFQSSNVSDASENTLTDEVNYRDLPHDEIQSEESVKFENWMINASGWIKKPCH